MGLKTSVKVNENTYSKQTHQRTKQALAHDIMDAMQETPELRREIARVFQMANRRIQNLQAHDGDVISPALASLGERANIEGYSKFRIGQFGHSSDQWELLKDEYSRAVAFLQQPTSTVTGARELESHIKDVVISNSKVKEPDIVWEAIKENIINGFNDVSPAMLAAMPYRDMMQSIYDKATSDASQQMEQDAKEVADALQRTIEEQASEIADEVYDSIDDFINSMMNSFQRL